MTLKVEDCVGKWVRFTQIEYGSEAGYVDKAFVINSNQVYLNTKDNPRCRPDSGYTSRNIPDWADYGWWMKGECDYKDLQLLDDLGNL